MREDVTAEKDLKVEGKSILIGETEMYNSLKLHNLGYAPESANLTDGYSILLKNLNNEVKNVKFEDLVGKITNFIEANPIEYTVCDLAGYIPNWNRNESHNALYTYCPETKVGIGTGLPTSLTETFTVNGTTIFLNNVGVGTSPHPEVELNVETDKKVGYCVNHTYQNDFGYAFKAIVNNDQSKGIGIYSEAYQKDVFTVYGNGKIEVNNNSGTTFRIEADGLLRSRQIKIDTDNWPDYVFSPDYEMLTLSETESFIDKNGHLPGVPSAEEVEKDGMDVEAMNKILLEKIEELTLRLIQQEKMIISLKNEN